MHRNKKQIVLHKVCFHRGVGKENTLEAIEAAIRVTPFMSEFDCQWRYGKLRLGHPPEHEHETLEDALKLFSETHIMPKIDLKLDTRTFTHGLDALIEQLNVLGDREALINISGELNSTQYMIAEKELMQKTSANTLLNIDLERYDGKTLEQINAHLKRLERLPFSISPNLDSVIEQSITLAKDMGIPHIHFWSYFDAVHTIDSLYDKMMLCQNKGLEVYFDIKATNIQENLAPAT